MTTENSPANQLCKACGLCCTGHLFVWVKLRPSELDPAEAMGLHVYRDDPTQRGFSLPCPLWQGACTIYTSRHYPKGCRAYTCDVYDELVRETLTLPEALAVIEQFKAMVRELEPHLPPSNAGFRERLVAYLEDETRPPDPDDVLQQKAHALIAFYATRFGVKDLLEKPIENE